MEEKIFLSRWSEMQSDIVSTTYMLEPLFVEQSQNSVDCTVKLWTLAHKVLRVKDDAAWSVLHGRMVEQLAKFQG